MRYTLLRSETWQIKAGIKKSKLIAKENLEEKMTIKLKTHAWDTAESFETEEDIADTSTPLWKMVIPHS